MFVTMKSRINELGYVGSKSRSVDQILEKTFLHSKGLIVGVGVGVSKKSHVKVFYVMGKALSGELSCPCDRSCSEL